MENLTGGQVMNAIVVILAILAALVAVDKGIDVIKKWRKPQGDVLEQLRQEKERLDKHAKQIENLEKGVKSINEGVVALLDHELHNGNGDQMQRAREGIQAYLNSLIGGS